jgi:hypothetical protein
MSVSTSTRKKITDGAMQALLCLTIIVISVTTFLMLGVMLQLEELTISIVVACGVIAITLLTILTVTNNQSRVIQWGEVLPISLLAIAGIGLALGAVYQLSAYIRLPVDLLSFSESNFVNDIQRLRMGLTIYTDPLDNNAYPYNPGTQLLTYAVSAAFGASDSIPALRMAQFSFVIFAAIVATSFSDLLARLMLPAGVYRNRPLWMLAWLPFLFLVAVEPHFNLYNHSLHNDGLALLVSMCAFWLIARHAVAPRAWILLLMAILPAVGFMVKQNQVMWFGIFVIYFLLSRSISWRQLFLLAAASVAAVLITVAINRAVWGEHYFYWILNALGDKSVSPIRSALHFLQAGMYASLGLFVGWFLVLPNRSQKLLGLWTCWLVLFSLEAYTSGLGWQTNHLGPGVVLATSWFLVALPQLWEYIDRNLAWWRVRAQEAISVVVVILLFAGVGNIWLPTDPIPDDFNRYVAEIENEFAGLETEKVLMDFGTWIYLRDGVLMKDRAAPVSLHVGINQPEINHAALASTVQRIEQKSYDKILARQLDTGETMYDFHDRGSGVKAAILENYQIVRRIPGVASIQQWWPPHLVSEILVLVPNDGEHVDNTNDPTQDTPKSP